MAQLILLTEPELRDAVANTLAAAAPAVRLAFAPSLAALEGALSDGGGRILSVGAGFIVPEALLRRAASAYNLHPGPPEYPGIFPSVFALNDRAAGFGVTLHEMAARVDSGPIVAVDRFAIDRGWNRLALDTAAFTAMIAMLKRLAPALTNLSSPLAPSGEAWSGPLRTKREFEALCRLPETATADEFEHRLRAVGEGPNHALIVTRYGRAFRLVSDGGEVVRAGTPVA